MLEIERLGRGPDLALVHGWGFDSRVWRRLAGLLAADFSVHLVDLPGYGRNRQHPLADFSATADLLAASLPNGTTLAGWSLGGQLAIAAAAGHPGHFGRLVLIATTPSFIVREGWPDGMAPLLLAGFQAAARAGALELVKRFAGLIHHGDASARDLSRLYAAWGCDGLPGTEALLAGLDWLRDNDLRPLLPQLALPVLIVHGDADPLMPTAAAVAMAKALPQADLAIISGAAHAPFAGDPARFASRVAAFALQTTAQPC
jgi:pimeloyl-[acyl-carrier protein] methyl ester esterase